MEGECTLLATSGECCDGMSHNSEGPARMGFSRACSTSCSLRSAQILLHDQSDGNRIHVAAKSQVASLGSGPNSLSVDLSSPSRAVAVANYHGGNVGVLGPLHPDGTLLKSEVIGASKPLSSKSLAHHVSFQPCGGGRPSRVLVADAGDYSVAVVDAATAGVVDTIRFPTRLRQLALHPTLPFAYAIYEFDGTVGIWQWSRSCDTPRAPGSRAASATTPTPTPVEVARVVAFPPNATSLSDQIPRGAPLRLLLPPQADFLYVCTRGPGYVAVFRVEDSGAHLVPVQFMRTGGPNPRECTLSPSGDQLLVVDQSDGTLSAFGRDEVTGALALRKSIGGLDQPCAVAVWIPPTSRTCRSPFPGARLATVSGAALLQVRHSRGDSLPIASAGAGNGGASLANHPPMLILLMAAAAAFMAKAWRRRRAHQLHSSAAGPSGGPSSQALW